MFEVDFNKPPYIYWSDITKVDVLQRYIIVHSIIYYHLNQSCITDKEYDLMCQQLVDMQKRMDKQQLRETMYYYCMFDFDGSTGFDLYGRLVSYDKQFLTKVANNVIRQK